MRFAHAALSAVIAAAFGGAAIAAPTPAGDAQRGAAIYMRCAACHSLQYDRTGPRHCRLLGRKAGSVPGFKYSAAIKDSRLTWDAKTLDRFLADPPGVVPGTAMTYAGVPDPQERADLIEYLRKADASAECRAAR